MRMLQIRNVPDDLHRRLKSRAALEGTSLSDYALAELRRSLERPTRAELLERVQQRTPTEALGESATDAVRAERDAR
jgi:plasmid stability protein